MAEPETTTTDEQFDRIDALLAEPCWVIDLLPSQVPANAPGRFFAVERLLLEGPGHAALRRRFADVVLKLYCYHDYLVFRGEKPGKENPKAEKLERWVLRNEHLCIFLPAENALLMVPTDSTCMALHNPTPELLEQVRALATASGLFVWQPPA